MVFLIVSFVAGALTVLTPCVLPILPLVLGASATGAGGEKLNKNKPFIIILSLAVSIFIFTFLLKVSTVFINVPENFWQYVSAAIIFVFGLSLIFPLLWARLTNSIFNKSNRVLTENYNRAESPWKSIAIGASLGPVFTTCSPTFFLILATVLPSSLGLGVLYLLAYDVGLSIFLLLIATLGQKVVNKFFTFSTIQESLNRYIGIIFILLAIAIGTGVEKKVEADLLTQSGIDFTTTETAIKDFLQNKFSNTFTVNTCSASGACPGPATSADESATTTSKNISVPNQKAKNILDPSYKTIPFIEISKPSGFVNTAPFKLGDLVGKKVVLVDFMTYSCINCMRTYPYLKDWYAKYKDQGLEIVAIQTPEFSFEKKLENVEASAKENGLTFPIVLDNDYGTWNAYQNQYWPHKYLIDINGNIVYDHIGEGNYKETEEAIVKLLQQRSDVLGGKKVVDESATTTDYSVFAYSPETYFGAMRNQYFGNGSQGVEESDTFKLPDIIVPNNFYLEGKWDVSYENISGSQSGSSISYTFNAKDVYMVAEADIAVSADVYVDGKKTQTLSIKDSKLYHVVSLTAPGEHTLKIIFNSSGVRLYTFTFG